MKKAILIVDESDYEREKRAPASIEARSMGSIGCVSVENPVDAQMKLHFDEPKGIIGVISALRFSSSQVSEVIDLAAECKAQEVPLVVCISREDDCPTEFQLKALSEYSVVHTIAERGRKDGERAVGLVTKRR